jgi:surface antigen
MLKDSCVGSPMVLGSLLTMSILISGCSGGQSSYYGDISTASGYVSADTPLGILFNMAKYSAYSVPKEDRDKHEQCVYFSLDTLFIGEKCDWYSKNGATHGTVKVVAHRQQGSGSCTTIFNSVFHKGKWANWQNTACRTTGSQWRFVPR